MQIRSSNPILKILCYVLLVFSCFIFIIPSNSEECDFYGPYIGSSCTIFTIAIGNTVYFGNTEDYLLNNVYRWYMPAQSVMTSEGIKQIFGAVFVGFDNNGDLGDGYEQGGMNEYGVCFDANGLPPTPLNLGSGISFPYTTHVLAETLWECKNVSEVIQWYETHGWSGSMSGQIHYADANGDAVVVSANSSGQWAFTRIDSSFLVSTNFNLANTANGWYPCYRYNTATNMLRNIETEGDLTIQACADVLYAVHQEGTYGTKYANIFDPVNLKLYFCRGYEFSWQRKYDLEYQLSHGIFEKKTTWFGVTGVDGEGVRVKTNKIKVQFYTGDAPDSTWVWIVSSIGGLTVIGSIITTLFFVKKKKKNIRPSS